MSSLSESVPAVEGENPFEATEVSPRDRRFARAQRALNEAEPKVNWGVAGPDEMTAALRAFEKLVEEGPDDKLDAVLADAEAVRLLRGQVDYEERAQPKSTTADLLLGLAGAAGGEVLQTTCAADVKVKPDRWLVKGRIPRGCAGSLYGPPGEGKSTLMGEIVAAATTGRCAFGEKYRDPTHGHVLWISAEESSGGRVVPRLMAAGADITKVHVDACLPTLVNKKTGTREITLTVDDIEAIRRRVLRDRDNGVNIVLIVLDPITSFVGRTKLDGKMIDDNRTTELRRALDPLGKMADELDITVLAIAHTNKNSKAGALDRLAGSGAYAAAMRFACAVSRDPEDEEARLMKTIKCDMKAKDSAVVFREEKLTDDDAKVIRSAPQLSELSDADKDDKIADLRKLKFDEPKYVNDGDLFGAPKVSETVQRGVEDAKIILSNGDMASTDFEADMIKQGYTESAVGRVKTALRKHGIRTWKQGFGSEAKTMIGHKAAVGASGQVKTFDPNEGL